MLKRLSLIAVSLFTLAGCTSIMPNNSAPQFNQAIDTGNYDKAATIALEESGYDPEDQTISDILWAIEAGAMLNYTGDYELSTDIFDATEKAMKEGDQEGAVKGFLMTGLSMIGNDSMMPYKQTQYDGTMANTFKAWNFMLMGDYNNARVEWNRAEERQRRAVEAFAEQIKEQKEALENESEDKDFNLMALITETIGNVETQKALKSNGIELEQWKPYGGYVNPFTTYSYGLNLLLNADSSADYGKARDAFKRVYGLTDSKQVKKDIQVATKLMRNSNSSDNMVWVIYENGQSMIKEEFRIDVPLFVFTDNVVYTGMALPRLKERASAYPFIEVDGTKTEVIADMDRIISAEFAQEFPMILTRELSRAVLKTIAQKQVNDSNPLAGMAAGLLQAATTAADVRTFSTLPKQYQTAQLTLSDSVVKVKAGDHEIPVELNKNTNKHVIYVKAVNTNTAPVVRVIDII